MSIRRTLAVATALATLTFASPAFADAITLDSGDIGQDFTLNYDGFADGQPIDNLSASTTFTLTGISGNNYTFDYSVTNTTGSPLTSRVSSFAFNTDPNIVAASSTGAFAFTTLSSNYPNGIGTVDVCFKDASTGSCAGGGSGGLTAGQTGTGTFTLSFSQPVGSLTLSDFFDRYQSITGAGGVGSASGSGTISSTSTSTGGTPVPEPGMLGLLGFGLIGVGLARRRRQPSLRMGALPLAA